MTKEEAIANIKRGKCIPYKHETLTTIIEALKTQPCDTLKLDGMLEDAYEHGYIQAKHDFEAQPCEDAVSRAEVEKFMYRVRSDKYGEIFRRKDLQEYFNSLPSVQPERAKGVFTRQELEDWLYSVCLNNDGTDFCKEIIDEIISRLDGFEKYVKDMRGE